MLNKNENKEVLNCPLGGDESNNCKDCIYSIDYQFVNGECIEREDNN